MWFIYNGLSEPLVRVLYWGDVAFFLGCGAFVVSNPQRHAHFVIGIGLAAVTFLFWVLARIQLGKSFAIGARATALVTRGLYAKFRHPVYVFGGLAYLGLFIA